MSSRCFISSSSREIVYCIYFLSWSAHLRAWILSRTSFLVFWSSSYMSCSIEEASLFPLETACFFSDSSFFWRDAFCFLNSDSRSSFSVYLAFSTSFLAFLASSFWMAESYSWNEFSILSSFSYSCLSFFLRLSKSWELSAPAVASFCSNSAWRVFLCWLNFSEYSDSS